MGSLECMEAAKQGHLEVLQWARGEGCRWDIYTCLEAAAEGHLEVLQWAREQGCPSLLPRPHITCKAVIHVRLQLRGPPGDPAMGEGAWVSME